MKKPTTKRLTAITGAALITGTLALAQPAANASGPTTATLDLFPDGRTVASAHAFGTRVKNNAVAESGRTAYATMCTLDFSDKSRNYIAASEDGLRDNIDVAGVHSINRTTKPGGNKTVTSKSTIASGDLFDGAVKFEGLVSVAKVTRTPNGYKPSHRVYLASLSVDGNKVPLDENVPPTKIEVPGVGTLFLAKQTSKITGTGARAATQALRLDANDGTSARIGVSSARLSGQSLGIFRGAAWGSDVNVANLVGSQRTGLQPLGCDGTKGKTKTNNTAEVGVPGVVAIDVTESTAQTSKRGKDGARAVTTNRVAGVSLGDGQITVEVIKASALVQRKTNGKVIKEPFSRILGFKINGETQTLPVDGESLEIPGLATIETNVVEDSPRGLQITALRVTLLDASGNPVVVNLGNASAYVSR